MSSIKSSYVEILMEEKDGVSYLCEHIISIGLNPDHEKFREQYRNEIHDILRKSYEKVSGGYSGLGSGTQEESSAIHADITNSMIKATLRDGKVSSVKLYKDRYGRKSVAAGTDGTRQGIRDLSANFIEDVKMKRAWSEVSGKPEAMMTKAGAERVPASLAAELTGKSDIEIGDDGYHYTRKIGNDRHEKVILGYPKL